jgi:hypothetical protein
MRGILSTLRSPATYCGITGRAKAPGLFASGEKQSKAGPEHLKTRVAKGGTRGTRLLGGACS